MAVTCKNCGGQHPTWECKKPAPKIAAKAAKKVLVRGDGVEGKGHAGAASEHSKVEAPKTLLPSGRVENTPDGPAVTVAAKFNKTAYMREYMRKRPYSPAR